MTHFRKTKKDHNKPFIIRRKVSDFFSFNVLYIKIIFYSILSNIIRNILLTNNTN